MRMMFVSAVAIAATATAAAAQNQPASRPTGERPDAVQTYLQQKAEEFAASERAAQGTNRGGDVTSLYNLLRDKGPFRGSNVQGRDAAEQDQVRDALVRTTAYYLASVGMKPADVNRLQRAGLDPLASGAAVIAGRATLADALTVAEHAVIARVTAVEGNAASIERTLRFAPVRSIKGDAGGAPFALQVELPHPSDAEAGDTYLLFLSDDLTGFRRAAGRKVMGGTLSLQLPPLTVEGDRLVGTVSGQERMASTVAELDALVSRHAAAFNTNDR
jgi:hypothetical protein